MTEQQQIYIFCIKHNFIKIIVDSCIFMLYRNKRIIVRIIPVRPVQTDGLMMDREIRLPHSVITLVRVFVLSRFRPQDKVLSFVVQHSAHAAAIDTRAV